MDDGRRRRGQSHQVTRLFVRRPAMTTRCTWSKRSSCRPSRSLPPWKPTTATLTGHGRRFAPQEVAGRRRYRHVQHDAGGRQAWIVPTPNPKLIRALDWTWRRRRSKWRTHKMTPTHDARSSRAASTASSTVLVCQDALVGGPAGRGLAPSARSISTDVCFVCVCAAALPSLIH